MLIIIDVNNRCNCLSQYCINHYFNYIYNFNIYIHYIILYITLLVPIQGTLRGISLKSHWIHINSSKL